MPRFHYKAASTAGLIIESDMMAATRLEVVGRVQALGHVPIHVDEAGKSWSGWLTRDLLTPRQVSGGRALSGFIRQLGILLRAGLPLDRTLEILQEVAERRGEAETPRRLLDKIRSGSTLADAMAGEPLFPEFCVSMVRAGEASGALETVLDRLADFLERSEASKAKLKSAMLYPCVVLVACMASLVILFTFVIPRFAPFFEDAHVVLPFTTRAMLAAGNLFQRFWYVPPALAMLLLAYLLFLAKSPAHRRGFDGLVLKLPAIGGLIRKVEIAHFSRVLGTLLKNGVPLTNALQIGGGTIRNRVMARAMSGVLASVREGKGLAEPLVAAGVVPTLALRLVRVGEEAARLDDMLLEVATIYDWETAQTMDRLLAMLGPALTIVLGLVVAGVIGSIMTAILSVYQLAM